MSGSVLEQLKSKAILVCKHTFQRAQEVRMSKAQVAVSSTLRDMCWIVEDERHCPRSGYSIDMHVRTGLEDTSSSCWAVEFDGPSHFLDGVDGAPTGATLIKRRHLELLGYNLVSIPHWEWNGLTENARREYLTSRLAA